MKNLTEKYMTIAQYARYRDMAEETIRKYIKGDILPHSKVGRTYRIDVDEADRIWLESINPNAEITPQMEAREKELNLGPAPERPKNIAEGSQTYADWRTKKEKWASKKAEIEYKFKAGKLVDAEKVKKMAFETGQITRDSLMALPDRLSHEFAAEMDAKKISYRLEEEIAKCLEEINRVPSRLKKITEEILRGEG